MIDAHVTAVEADFSVSCTCGWHSLRPLYPWDAERYAVYHRLAVGATIPNPLFDAFLAPPSEDELGETSVLVHMRRRDTLVMRYAWAIPTENIIRKLAELSPICDLGCGTGYWASLLQRVGAQVLAVDAEPPAEGNNSYHRVVPTGRFPPSPRRRSDDPMLKTRRGTAAHRSALLRREPLRPDGYRIASVVDVPLVEQASTSVERAAQVFEVPRIQHFTEIVRGTADTFDVPPSHALMLCWPPMSSMAETALRRYRGDRVIYIGEDGYGCTGSDGFRALLEDHWEQTATYEIPQWQGVHDAVYVYRRRKP